MELSIVSPDGCMVAFKLRNDTLVKRMHRAYCERQAVSIHNINLYHNGTRLNLDKTVSSQGLKSGDTINAILCDAVHDTGIKLTIKSIEGFEDCFRIDKGVKISTLLQKYKEKYSLSSVIMVHNILEFDENQNIESIGFEDGDILTAIY